MKKVVTVIGIALLFLANIIAIVYGVYLWGSVGLAFNVATWAAVKVWCIFLGSGLLLTFSGYLIKS